MKFQKELKKMIDELMFRLTSCDESDKEKLQILLREKVSSYEKLSGKKLSNRYHI